MIKVGEIFFSKRVSRRNGNKGEGRKNDNDNPNTHQNGGIGRGSEREEKTDKGEREDKRGIIAEEIMKERTKGRERGEERQ